MKGRGITFLAIAATSLVAGLMTYLVIANREASRSALLERLDLDMSLFSMTQVVKHYDLNRIKIEEHENLALVTVPIRAQRVINVSSHNAGANMGGFRDLTGSSEDVNNREESEAVGPFRLSGELITEVVVVYRKLETSKPSIPFPVKHWSRVGFGLKGKERQRIVDDARQLIARGEHDNAYHDLCRAVPEGWWGNDTQLAFLLADVAEKRGELRFPQSIYRIILASRASEEDKRIARQKEDLVLQKGRVLLRKGHLSSKMEACLKRMLEPEEANPFSWDRGIFEILH